MVRDFEAAKAEENRPRAHHARPGSARSGSDRDHLQRGQPRDLQRGRSPDSRRLKVIARFGWAQTATILCVAAAPVAGAEGGATAWMYSGGSFQPFSRPMRACAYAG